MKTLLKILSDAEQFECHRMNELRVTLKVAKRNHAYAVAFNIVWMTAISIVALYLVCKS